MKKPPDNYKKRLIRHVQLLVWVSILLGLLVAVGGIYAFTQNIGHLASLADLGTFLSGTTGALFSLAAVLFIYVTVLEQDLQLAIQSRALIDAQEQAKRERFESVFFELLNLHNNITNTIEDVNPDVPDDEGQPLPHRQGSQHNRIFTGRALLSLLSKCLSKDYLRNVSCDTRELSSEEAEKARTIEVYMHFFTAHQGQLGHYFRNLYHVVLFVDQSPLIMPEKRKYMKILRAQLSSAELVLLFYNGLGEYGKEKFYPLIEKYALLEQFDCATLLCAEHEAYYERSGYPPHGSPAYSDTAAAREYDSL